MTTDKTFKDIYGDPIKPGLYARASNPNNEFYFIYSSSKGSFKAEYVDHCPRFSILTMELRRTDSRLLIPVTLEHFVEKANDFQQIADWLMKKAESSKPPQKPRHSRTGLYKYVPRTNRDSSGKPIF